MRVIGVKCSLQQSIIQIERKRQVYQGIRHFTEINHSKKSPKYGGIGVKSNLQKSFIQKKTTMLDYRGKSQFTAINHSNRAQKTGLSGYRAVHHNQSFK
jgi:hypothetical protein